MSLIPVREAKPPLVAGIAKLEAIAGVL